MAATATKLKEIERRIADLASVVEAQLGIGERSVAYVIPEPDGRVCSVPDIGTLFVISAVPSGKFIPVDDPGEGHIEYRNKGRNVMYHRKIGIKMCRQYREQSNPFDQWESYFVPPKFIDAPELPPIESPKADAPILVSSRSTPLPVVSSDAIAELSAQLARARETPMEGQVDAERYAEIMEHARFVGGSIDPDTPNPAAGSMAMPNFFAVKQNMERKTDG